MVKAPDASLCPLCAGPNACAMEVARLTGTEAGACWCTGVVFPEALLASVPDSQRQKACVCKACADRFNRTKTPISSLILNK